MGQYYIAVTYDVCEHNNLYEYMNEYHLDLSIDMDKQIREFAKMDVAPIVKVYESDASDPGEFILYKEYKFKKYECGCNQ
ncbi:hypothetical protein JOC34_003448 [Virgibacillus halotolerans]|uniref:hypothetical protein n=1 Tax=Virgibacillus halotolerans TaxID=1071053 RepID=UPI0019610B33|nr:hypothetical protein [Virgibacillus halotolerans]MBM7601027.1 hypothetical protein [Virgibacillus halotolerans]